MEEVKKVEKTEEVKVEKPKKKVHIVQKGESLYTIAKENTNGNVIAEINRIIAENNLKSDAIYVGQKLMV